VTKGIVVIYFSQLAPPQRAHQRALLANDARAIALYKKYEFADNHHGAQKHGAHVYFVPDDTLLTDEARNWVFRGTGISSAALFPIFLLKQNRSRTRSSRMKRRGQTDGLSLSPDVYETLCCRDTPFLADAMPALQQAACSRVGPFA
jgi:hypothetical protein